VAGDRSQGRAHLVDVGARVVIATPKSTSTTGVIISTR
jgi:hypothetical protein